MGTIREKSLRRQVTKILDRLPGLWYTPVPGSPLLKGIPDIIGCYQGHFFALELKTGTKLSPLQKHVTKQIGNAMGTAITVTPENVGDLEEGLLRAMLLNTP